MQLGLAVGVELIEDEHEQVAQHCQHLVVVLLHLHLEVQPSELTHVAVG